MKRIVIFNDIHGNVTALRLIKEKINELKPDMVFSPGDFIGIGPSFNEVVQEIQTIPNFYATIGNHEKYSLFNFHNSFSSFEEQHHQFIKAHLKNEYVYYLRTLPISHYFNIEGFKICLIHYAVIGDKYTTIIRHPKASDLDQLYQNIDADMIIYGHEHKGDYIEGDKIYLNVGSSGCSNNNVGFVKMALLTLSDKTYKIEDILIPYDITPEINKMDEINLPDKEKIKEHFFVK